MAGGAQWALRPLFLRDLGLTLVISHRDYVHDIMPTRLAFAESRFTLRASIQISVAYFFFRQMSPIPPLEKKIIPSRPFHFSSALSQHSLF